jgi:two-component system, sensor histidine kinase
MDEHAVTGSAMNQRRLLIVEDHPESRKSFQTLLTMWGYRVEVAQDGLEGFEMALTWKPDVVILDIDMPILNGYEVARALRKLGSTTTLIALTAHTQPEDRERALDSGFNEHFGKPADLDHLMSVLTQGCARAAL